MKNFSSRASFIALALSTLAALAPAGCADLGADDESFEPIDDSSGELVFVGAKCPGTPLPAILHEASVTGPNVIGSDSATPFGFDPLNAVLARAPLYYVSAPWLTTKLVTSSCGYVKEAWFDDRLLTTTPTDGYWYTVTTLPAPADPTRVAYSVQFNFPKGVNGDAGKLRVVLGNSGGTATTETNFNIARVFKVNVKGTIAPVTVGSKELQNQLAIALYEQFGGANNAVLAGGQRIYGLDHDYTYMTASPSGLSFGFRFQADVDNYCDPTVQVGGTFRLSSDALGIFPIWVTGPNASFDWGGCTYLGLIPVLGTVLDAVVNHYADADAVTGVVQTQIESQVAAMMTSSLLSSMASKNKQLNANISPFKSSVTVMVPYYAFDSGKPGLPLRAGDHVMLLGSDVVLSGSMWSGPNGVPRIVAASLPGVEGFVRATTSGMAWSDREVGRLAARSSSLLTRTDWLYSPGCRIDNAGATTREVLLGVNDTAADAAGVRLGGSSTYTLTAMFMDNDGEASLADACESRSTSLVPTK